ncbi:MAG: hypothetical protein ACD_75C01839G0001 [uncultured bacterium]|nr:MAG: hypothetical protein ACD_75C01839G0001 [uncultured bacterium]
MHLVAHIGGEDGLLGEQPLIRHVMEGAEDPLRLRVAFIFCFREWGKTGQLIGAEPLVAGPLLHHGRQNRQPPLPLPRRKIQPVDLGRRLFQIPDQRLALKDPVLVLVALQIPGPLQPGDGGAHPGVAVGQFVRVDIDHIEAEQLACRHHHFVSAL